MGKLKLSLILSLMFLFCTLALLVSSHPVARATSTTIFSDGFETGDFSAWTNTTGSPELTTTAVYDGSYAMNVTANTQTATKMLGSAYANIFVRVFVRFSVFPASEVYGVNFLTVGSNASWPYATTVRLQNIDGTNCSFGMWSGAHAYTYGSDNVQLDTWYCIELNRNTGGNTTLYVNGVSAVSYGIEFYDADRIDVGGEAQLSSAVYLDDVVVSDSYIGQGTIQVTFDQTGLGSDFPGTVVTVDGIDYTFLELPASFWWVSSSVHNFAFASPLSVDSVEQYLWDSTAGLSFAQSGSLTATSSGTVTGNYVAQYKVTFDASSNVKGDSADTIVTVDGTPKTASDLPFTTGWISSGTPLPWSFSSPVASNSSPTDTRYRWDSTSGLGQTGQSGTLTVTASGTVIGNYVTQYQVSFNQTGLDGDAGSNTVLVVGATDYAYADFQITNVWVDSGTTFSWTATVSGGAGKQFVLTGDSGLASPIVAPGTSSATYNIQYYLTVDTSPSSVNSPTGEGWYDTGVTAHVSTDQFVDIVPGSSRYRFDSWTGASGTYSDATVVMDAAKTATANYVVQYYLTVDSAYGTPGGEGWYDANVNAQATITPLTVAGTTGTQYVFTGWSGDATGSGSPSDNVLMDAPKTATATWAAQYSVTFAETGLDGTATGTVMYTNASSTLTFLNFTGLPYSVWVNSSDTVNYNYQVTVLSTVSNQRFRFDTDNGTYPLIITSPTTIVGEFSFQYNVTFDQFGVGGDFSGVVMSVNGVNYTSAGHSEFFDVNASVSFNFYSPLIVTPDAKQYVWTSTGGLSGVQSGSITVYNSGTVDGNYVTQWYIAVTSAHDTPTASGWVDDGGSFPVSVTSPADVVSGDHQWVCSGYKLDGGSLTSGTTYTFTNVTIAHTIEFDWAEQFYVAFGQSGVGSDFSGDVIVVNATNSYDRTGGSFWANPGDVYEFLYISQLTVDPSNNIKQYVFVSANETSPFSVSGPETVTGIYKTQYYVFFAQSGVDAGYGGTVVTVNGTDYDSDGFAMWADPGDVFYFTYSDPLVVSAGQRDILMGVNGTSPLTVTEGTTIMGSYVTQYLVTYSATGNVLSVTVPSDEWVDSGGSAVGAFPLQVTAAGTRCNFVSDNRSAITEPSLIVGTYQTQFNVTFDETGVGSDFAGTVVTIDSVNYSLADLSVSFWWDGGSGLNFSFASPLVVNASKQYTWSSTSGLLGLQSGTLTVTASGNVVGNYIIQNQVTFDKLGLSSDFSGTALVVDGTNYTVTDLPVSFSWSIYSVHTFAYQSPLVVGVNSKQYVWTGTTGLSSLQSDSINVTTFGSIIGHYKTQWYLSVTSAHGSPTASSGWVDDSSSFTVSVTNPDVVAANQHRWNLTGLSVDGAPQTLANSVSFGSVAGNHTIIFSWTEQFYLTVGTSPASVNSPTGEGWYDTGVTATVTTEQYIDIVLGSSRYRFDSWTGATGGYSGATVTMSSAKTATANYVTQYSITFDQDGLDGSAIGTVVTVNSTAKTLTGLPFSFWVNSSDSLVFTYSNVSSTASDMRFIVDSVSSNSPLTVTGSVTIVGTYKTELLTMQLKGTKGWYWTQDTTVTSIVQGDLYGDGNVEIITGGYYFDGVRDVAQLVVWNGSNRAVLGVTVWYWYGDTTINSVAIGDLYGNGSMEIVTGGSYFDGVRHVAQLVVWDASTLTVRQVKVWTWVNDTTINSVAISDVDGDGHLEIVTGGYYFDNTRDVAQLVVWDGSTLTVKQVKVWTWGNDTTINSLAVGDVDGDGHLEIVTGGYYFDGTRDAAQLVVWNATLAVKQMKVWSWTGNTTINSVAIGDVYSNGSMEIVTGGSYFDGTRNVAQLVVWNGSNMAVDGIKVWYWFGDTAIHSIAISDVDGDGHMEIVTGGYYFDGTRNVAQLVVWDGSNLTVKQVAVWFGGGNTVINCVIIGDVNDDGTAEIVTGGNYYDGTRTLAQITVWTATYS